MRKTQPSDWVQATQQASGSSPENVRFHTVLQANTTSAIPPRTPRRFCPCATSHRLAFGLRASLRFAIHASPSQQAKHTRGLAFRATCCSLYRFLCRSLAPSRSAFAPLNLPAPFNVLKDGSAARVARAHNSPSPPTNPAATEDRPMSLHPTQTLPSADQQPRRALALLALLCCVAVSLIAALSPSAASAQDNGVSTLEAGDPGYENCRSEDFLKRCFRVKLEAGKTLTLSEKDFGLTGSQLAVYERKHPFTAQVNKQDFTITVPQNYLWAEVRLETLDGQKLLLLAYSDLRLARAALAQFEREVKDRDPKTTPQTFYAEHTDLSGDKLSEVIIYGGSGRTSGAADSKTNFGLISSADGKLKHTSTTHTYPALRTFTLNLDDSAAPVSVLTEGFTGCDTHSDLRVWRLSPEYKTVDLFDVKTTKGMYGIPDGWAASDTKKLWTKLNTKDATLESIDLFDSADACKKGSGGYQIFWKNGSPRGRKL
jgi:hypothetical protein